jgi:thiamine pyrophosphate-dependent acetolactate synthase large subunit-like protein
MKCIEAVAAIVEHRASAVIVSTMTAIKCLDQIDKNGLNVACVPLMGGASALGVGIALARPERKVFALDGDGSLLMQLPSLVGACEAAAPNFVHFVFNNGVWFENLANIPIPGAGRLDFVGLARSAGYRHTFRFTDIGSLRSGLKEVLSVTDPTFVELVIEPEATGLWKDGNTQPDLPDFHFTRLGDEIRDVRSRLLSTEKGPA